MEVLTLSPLATILLTAALCALTGFYIGKTSGLRAAERAYRLARNDYPRKDNSSVEMDTKEREKAIASGGEEDWESEDEDGDADVKKFENSHEPCKMVSLIFYNFLSV